MAAVDQVDPEGAQNGAAYLQALQRLRVAAGKPSLRELSRRAKPGQLPVSTLSDALRRDDLPPWRVVEPLLEALGVSQRRLERWRTVWQRLAEPGWMAAHTTTSAAHGGEDASAQQPNMFAAPPTTSRRAKDLPLHPKQLDAAAEELASWLQRTLIRPNKHKNEERVGILQIDHLSAIDPGESRQLYDAGLKAGDDVGCWAEHPLLQYKTLYHCFAKGEDADSLSASQLPNLFWAKIRCLGQIRVIEMDMVPWDDEDRGVAYHTAYLISELRGPDTQDKRL